MWPSAVLSEREWRSALYTGSETPLSPEARAAFRGLQWFDPDPRFRIEAVKLERPRVSKPAMLQTTGADAILFVEAGTFSFDLLGAPARLLAFEPAPGESDEPYILVPFRDATSGRETYGAGRYLDLEPRDDDVYELDFNRAYHPYCAHDERWSCTLPPPENRLAQRVEAGERL